MISIASKEPPADLLGAAKFYRDRLGWTVHPVHGPTQGAENERGKKPKWSGYNKPGYQGINTEAGLVAEFGNGNGSNLGIVVRRPHVVIDLDSKPDGGQSVRAWLKEHPELADVPRERTAGGAHLHFLCHDVPGGAEARIARQLNSMVGVEVFVGPANVVVSPSIHPTGARYEWEKFGELCEVPWSFLSQTFKLTEPVELAQGLLPKRTWRGDETTLDIIGLCKELGIYAACESGETPKHSILCPWRDEHTLKAGSRDTSTVVCEPCPDYPSGYFKCKHGHCEHRGRRHFLAWAEEERSGIVDRYCEREYVSLADDPESAPHFRNDVGYADAFAQRFAGRLRYITEEQTWLTFDPQHGWRRDTREEVTALIMSFAREVLNEAYDEAKATKDITAANAKINAATRLGDKRRIAPALDFARANQGLVISTAQLDQDPYLLGVENGVVDLRTGSFHKHSPDVFVTRSCACEFDPRAQCPAFVRFFEEVQPDPEMREFLQRLCGYTLTGAMGEHILPFHYGVGRNGKGTFLEQVVLKVMGSYAAKVTDSLVYIDKRGSKPDLEIAGLCGIRFALGEENADKGHLNERLLKSMTGADRQKGRFHYKDYFEYDPTAKIHLVGNHRPVISGRDNGIWRRFRLINWEVEIPQEREDLGLANRLRAEFPGILNWLIAGAKALGAHGTRPPARVLAATAKFREDSDTFGDFLREKTIEDGVAEMPKKGLYDLYREWCDEQEIQPRFRYTKRKVGFVMLERGYNEGRTTGGVHVWRGLRERGPEDDERDAAPQVVTYNDNLPKLSYACGENKKLGEKTFIRHSEGSGAAAYRYVTQRNDLAEVAADLAQTPADRAVALDVETYGDDPFNPRRGDIRTLTVVRPGGMPWIMDLRALGYDLGEVGGELAKRRVTIHNARFDGGWLREKCGLGPRATDTLALSRLLTAGTNEANDLGAVLKRHLGVEIPKQLSKSDWGVPALTEDQLQYAARDVAYLPELCKRLVDEIVKAKLTQVAKLELDVLQVASEMTATGFAVDVDRLTAMRNRERGHALEAAITLQGKLGSINMASPKQLLKALQDAGHPVQATDNEALQGIKDKELAAGIIAYRESEKLAQQAQSLLEAAHNGRIHADYDPTGTATGRFSCKRPNLQNVARGELRDCFIAPPGKLLVVCDYSQVELRLAAYLSKDGRMLRAFQEGVDLHAATAAIVLGKQAAEVTKDDRQLAKAVNFGLLYGQSARGLVRYAKSSYGVALSEKRAHEIRDRFFRAYAGLGRWHKQAAIDARSFSSREVRTVLGRRQILPAGDWWPRFTRLVNTPVQGTAADGMKLSLVLLSTRLPQGAKLISAVHDEIIVECDQALADEALGLTKAAMIEGMGKVAGDCPIEVEGGTGTSWGSAK
jgi:DNA polymerase I